MTAGVSRAAMTIIPQPALAPSPQPRPAPTERALIAQNAEKGGPFWMPIRGPDRTLIDTLLAGVSVCGGAVGVWPPVEDPAFCSCASPTVADTPARARPPRRSMR